MAGWVWGDEMTLVQVSVEPGMEIQECDLGNSPIPKMATTCSSRVQLAVYDSPCPSQHLSPFENKLGGFPVSCEMSSYATMSATD